MPHAVKVISTAAFFAWCVSTSVLQLALDAGASRVVAAFLSLFHAAIASWGATWLLLHLTRERS